MSTFESRGRVMPLVVLVAIAGLVAGVVWFGARGNDAAAGTHEPGGSASPTGDGSVSKRLVPATPPTDGVELPQGGGEVGGHAVEFPYTDLGAVAIQAEVAKAQVGFDYEQAAAVAAIYAAPDDVATFGQRSRDAVALRRKQAGVPARGKVPAPASYAVTPLAFTVDELDTDYYVVNLLSYVTLTTADGKVSDLLYAGTQLVRWIDGDWKLVQATGAEYRQLIDEGQPQAVAPDTPEFDRAGWILIDGALQ
jgi:hypothetical protein